MGGKNPDNYCYFPDCGADIKRRRRCTLNKVQYHVARAAAVNVRKQIWVTNATIGKYRRTAAFVKNSEIFTNKSQNFLKIFPEFFVSLTDSYFTHFGSTKKINLNFLKVFQRIPEFIKTFSHILQQRNFLHYFILKFHDLYEKCTFVPTNFMRISPRASKILLKFFEKFHSNSSKLFIQFT